MLLDYYVYLVSFGFMLLAQVAAEAEDGTAASWASPVIQLVTAGGFGALVWYLVTKQIPKMQREALSELRKEREVNREEIASIIEDMREDRRNSKVEAEQARKEFQETLRQDREIWLSREERREQITEERYSLLYQTFESALDRIVSSMSRFTDDKNQH